MRMQRLVGLIILAILLSACSRPDAAYNPSINSGHDITEIQPDPMKAIIEQRCSEITAMYFDLYAGADKTDPRSQWDDPVLSQSSIDAIETLLTDAGLDIVDTDGVYPGYLTTADHFYHFWDNVEQGISAEQEILTIYESGDLFYRLFTHREGITYVYTMDYSIEDDSGFYYDKQTILEWELTDKGNLYYRIRPTGDKRYSDFALIRTAAPNAELCDLTMKYIWAASYLGTNIFLTDWTEDDFGALSFNDLWDSFYYGYYGQQFCPDENAYIRGQDRYRIPADEFEKVVFPYFDIDMDTFREMAQYEAEGDYYPWRQIYTNDFVFLYYYMIEPEVTKYEVNSDGTITLTVEILSTDLKTDCLFSHEVTVRPLENGSFQYVGNRVTCVTEYGLPYCAPRLTWDTRY